MFSSYRHVGNAHQGVGASGEDGQFFRCIRDVEIKLYALRAPDPVALHGAYLLRPTFEIIQLCQQLFGIGGDLDEPLRDLPALHQGA